MKLTEREKTIILAADKYALSDNCSRYYQLGGHGDVPVRYDHRTLPRLEREGLIHRENGLWKATPTGVATATESGAASVSGPNWKRNSWDALGL